MRMLARQDYQSVMGSIWFKQQLVSKWSPRKRIKKKMKRGKCRIFPRQSTSESVSYLRLWVLRGARSKKIQIKSSNNNSALTTKTMSISGSTTSRTQSCWIARLKSLKSSFRYNQCSASSLSARLQLQSHIGPATVRETIEMTRLSTTTYPRSTALCSFEMKGLRITEKISAVTLSPTARACPNLSRQTITAIYHQRATKCPQPSR